MNKREKVEGQIGSKSKWEINEGFQDKSGTLSINFENRIAKLNSQSRQPK